MKNFEFTIYDQNIWGNMPGTESISNRNGIIKDLILSYNADVCCFQECNPYTSRVGDTDISLLLENNYIEAKTPVGNKNFTPVFYRKDRFEAVESGYHIFEGRNDVASKSLTYCVLKEKASGGMVGVISTHFWWENKDEEDNYWRIENAKTVLSYMYNLQKKYNIPVFAAGDLNCGSNSPQLKEPWEYMKTKALDIRDIAEKTSYDNTCDPYPKKDENGIYHFVTTKKNYMIDHIFLTKDSNVKVHEFKVDNSERACDSSDHSPLIVKATV